MKVSIILPTYNSASTLKTALDSALNQDFPKQDFELIVINDGSTDNTAQVLEEYEKRIKVIIQENRGHLKASNRGFKEAKGEYIIKLDSDDAFREGILKEMAKVLDENPDIDFVCCNYYERKVNGEVEFVNVKENIFNTIGIGIMFRKERFKEQGFFNEKVMFAEYDLLLKTWGKWKGYCIEKPLFYYNRRKESITGDRSWLRKGMEQLRELYPDKIDLIEKIREY